MSSGKRRFEQATRFQTALLGSQYLDRAEQRIEGRERTLSEANRFLGTDAQIAGTGDFARDPRVAQFSGRFSLNEGDVTSLVGRAPGLGGALGGFDREPFDKALTTANDLMAQAQEAAEAGNFQLARDLRGQAVNATRLSPELFGGAQHGSPGYELLREPFEKAFVYETDPTLDAQALLSTPGAQVVGGLVRDARELQDIQSERYQEIYSDLTAGSLERINAGRTEAERAIASEFRAANARARDAAAGRGAGRMRFQEQATEARGAEAAATARANAFLEAGAQSAEVTQQAKTFLTTWTRDFQAATANFAQRWLQNEPGVRQGYHDALDRVAFTAVEFYDRLNERSVQRLTFLENLKASKSAARTQLIVSAVSTVVGFAIGSLGTIIGASITAGAQQQGGQASPAVANNRSFSSLVNPNASSTFPSLSNVVTPGPVSLADFYTGNEFSPFAGSAGVDY